jgi:hypothetical protein
MKALVLCMIVLAVVVSVSRAEAECAWVLWAITDTHNAGLKRDHPETYGSVPAEVYDGRTACETAAQTQREKAYSTDVQILDAMNAAAMNDNKAFVHLPERAPMGHVVRMYEKITGKAVGWTAHAWRCLPDTVDPRGPKGK